MTKQEFLAMSLPYDLVGITQNRLVKINGINYENQLPIIWDSINKEKSDFSGICGFGIMLILRPLSDLTKEIEHKGEKFVPIVVLAKMAWEEPLIKKFKIDREVLRYNFDGDEYYFEYRKNGRFLFARMTPYETFMPINNQFLLFQKLIEWHFDIADLISKGEATDVNTLDVNPYK